MEGLSTPGGLLRFPTLRLRVFLGWGADGNYGGFEFGALLWPFHSCVPYTKPCASRGAGGENSVPSYPAYYACVEKVL